MDSPTPPAPAREVVERLREHVRYQYMPADCRVVMDQAATLIEGQRKEIERLKNPTDEMIIAGDREAIDILNEPSFALHEQTLAERVYRAMSKRAALTESPDHA
jgi:hypothetical protein